jgi:transcriptional regulator with XRE-family HTH domain
LEQSNIWIAAVAFDGTASDYGSMYGLVEASRKAVEEGEMNTTVQKAIHDGMKATGITQTELAIVLRSRARASEIINGKRDLRRTELLVLSYLLHIPLETLIPPLSEEDKLHIDSLIAWERKLQETRYIKKRTSKRSKKSCPKN